MKNYIKRFVAIVAIVSACFWGCSPKGDSMIGEWKGTDNGGRLASIVLDKTNHATLIIGNEVIGGKDKLGENHDVELKYAINYNHDPYYLDLILTEAGTSNEISRIAGIFRFISRNKIELRMDVDMPGHRFETFDRHDDDHTLVLEKVSD